MAVVFEFFSLLFVCFPWFFFLGFFLEIFSLLFWWFNRDSLMFCLVFLVVLVGFNSLTNDLSKKILGFQPKTPGKKQKKPGKRRSGMSLPY